MTMFDETKVPLLTKALDVYSLRHKVISSNIANIGTPGYRSKSVEFEQQLASAMGTKQCSLASTNGRHLAGSLESISQAVPNVVESGSQVPGSEDPEASGVNDVDIDQQMTDLAKNQIQFKFATKLLSETFQDLEKSIRGTT